MNKRMRLEENPSPNTEEKRTKIISVAGLERCDVMYYAARYLADHGKKVLLVDNSISEVLNKTLAHGTEEGRKELFDRQNMYIDSRLLLSEEYFSYFDVVFVFHGMNPDGVIIGVSDKTYVQLNYETSVRDAVKESMGFASNMPIDIVLYDCIPVKVDINMYMRDAGLEAVQATYQIPYDEEMYRNYIQFLHNGEGTSKGCTEEMAEAIADMVAVVTEKGREETYKAIKKQIM